MKTGLYSWAYAALIAMILLAAISCQQPTLQTGYDIPPGTVADREPTYDDIVVTPGGGAYRGNVHEVGKPSGFQQVESMSRSLGNGFTVYWRSYIESKAGEFRYNMIFTNGAGLIPAVDYTVNLRLTNMIDGIRVERVSESDVRVYSISLQIAMSPEVKPGDYELGFLEFINGKYYGTLPCTVHVTK